MRAGQKVKARAAANKGRIGAGGGNAVPATSAREVRCLRGVMCLRKGGGCRVSCAPAGRLGPPVLDASTKVSLSLTHTPPPKYQRQQQSQTKQRARVEEEFAELLAEYGDEEIGELEDPAEADAPTKGQLEVGGRVLSPWLAGFPCMHPPTYLL